MSILAKACMVFVLAALAVPAATQRFMAASPDVVSRDRVVEQVRSLLGHGQDKERMASIGDILRPTVMALPRDSHGSLEHRVARYALYRYFLVERGWHIKGLSFEAGETSTPSQAEVLKSRMPSLIVEVLQTQMGSDRLGLEELVVLVATLEDLVHGDAVDWLGLAYKVHNVSTDDLLDERKASLLIRTFALYFFLPSAQPNAQTKQQVMRFLNRHASKHYPGWDDAMVWAEDVGHGLEYQDRSALRPFAAAAARHWDFTSMAQWATTIGAGFGRFTNIECKQMQNKLLDMEDEDREDGRVGLSKFYAEYWESGHVHFSESPAYLRHLGALDEQNIRKPSVILPNILYAKGNCLDTSGFHTVCCIDACESLMTGLEQQVPEPAAAPVLIAAVVSAMPSDTVAAPRNLSAPLRSRLDEIAGRHGGSVPLHSRLFAQWMHYAYPNECPYPRSLLTSEPQLGGREWEVRSKSSAKASRQEMRAAKDLADNGQEEQGASESPTLLWSEDEELLSDLFSVPQRCAVFDVMCCVAGMVALAASAFAMHRAVRGELSEKGGKPKIKSRVCGVSTSIESRIFLV